MSYTFFHGSPRVRSGPPAELKVTFIWRSKRHRVLFRDCVLFLSFCPHRLKQTKSKTKPIRNHVEWFHLFHLNRAWDRTVHKVKCPCSGPASAAPVHTWACPCFHRRQATRGRARDMFKLRYEVLRFFLWSCSSLTNLLPVSGNTELCQSWWVAQHGLSPAHSSLPEFNTAGTI